MNISSLVGEMWVQLQMLGLAPGLSVYLQGVKVRKTKGIKGFNVACKWRRKYQGWAPKEGWFILTNLPDFKSAIAAYKKRFDIEEMFRDCKSGGYNIEETKVPQKRLNTLILLIVIPYTSAIIQGGIIKRGWAYKNTSVASKKPRELSVVTALFMWVCMVRGGLILWHAMLKPSPS